MSAFGIEIEERAVRILGKGVTKHGALDALVDAVCQTGAIASKGAFRSAIYERESIQSTGVGGGVAIPHVRIEEVLRPVLGVGLSRDGVDFDSLDNEPVNVLVLFGMPSGTQRAYLDLLARVMVSVKDAQFREELLKCTSPAAVAAFLNRDG